MEKLLNLPTRILLDKLGAGNHIPGSGSAAALNGIIACKLLSTVIQLTLDPKRGDKYNHCQTPFFTIKAEIEDRICPRLEKLFQEDSDQFDKVITKRRERDSEISQAQKNELEKESQKELVTATNILFEVASQGIALAKYSVFVFDNGFKSARGDTSVALYNSLASIMGCLSIINLNMQSISNSETTLRLTKAKNKIQFEYDKYKEESIDRLDMLSAEAKIKRRFYLGLDKIKNRLHNRLIITDNEIEVLAKDIQNFLWKQKSLIWKLEEPEHPLGVLTPKKVIKLLKYTYEEVDTLGVNEISQEIAGEINNKSKRVLISKRYKKEIINFTAAHELGHALMHNDMILHRDIPLDGSYRPVSRPIKELQADKFAVYFLMPGKLVKEVFKEIFFTDYFEINPSTSIAIANCSPRELREKVRNLRGFSRLIAKLNFYNIQPITPVSAIFNVSIEAMAIRLEELDLVRF